ncbi:MAG: hypothetical protein KIT58_11845, partial [Planctomycetota bacterium]|nr:hypothetical protein [Planctomycetota bacterium]
MSEDDDRERSSEDGTDALVGAALLGLVALVALGFFGHGLLEAWWASGWLEAPGRVVEVDVRERHGRRGPSFIPEVRVAFEVDGRRYECRRERLGARVGDRDEDEAW